MFTNNLLKIEKKQNSVESYHYGLIRTQYNSLSTKQIVLRPLYAISFIVQAYENLFSKFDFWLQKILFLQILTKIRYHNFGNEIFRTGLLEQKSLHAETVSPKKFLKADIRVFQQRTESRTINGVKSQKGTK